MIPDYLSKRNIGESLKVFGLTLSALAFLSQDIFVGAYNLIGAGLCQLASGLILCYIADIEAEEEEESMEEIRNVIEQVEFIQKLREELNKEDQEQ